MPGPQSSATGRTRPPCAQRHPSSQTCTESWNQCHIAHQIDVLHSCIDQSVRQNLTWVEDGGRQPRNRHARPSVASSRPCSPACCSAAQVSLVSKADKLSGLLAGGCSCTCACNLVSSDLAFPFLHRQ